MKLLNSAILLICISFITGIALCLNLTIGPRIFVGFFIGSFLFFIFSFVRARLQIFQDKLFAVATSLIFICLGYSSAYLAIPHNSNTHYIHLLNEEPSSASIAIAVDKRLKSSSYYDNYVAEISRLDQHSTHGKILFSVKRDSSSFLLNAGDKLLLNADLKSVFKSGNPYQFDYRNYLQNQRILKQAVSFSYSSIKIQESGNSFLPKASFLRNKITTALQKNDFNKTHINLIQALFLGQKQELSKDIYTNFTKAGVVHILAVSGLHVGIILYLLYLFLSPLKLIKNGQVIRVVLAIICLWLYAALVGFTPSVLRAVTMFSCLSLGLFSRRKIFSLNMLFLSALLLLLANPYFIFSVGFQLSYAAVFMIVCFQPKLFKLWQPSNKVLRHLWGIFCVTLTAQIGILPLSLFYFHQLPGLFFISNILIVPFLGFILGVGILIIFLSFLGLLPVSLRLVFEKILDLLLFVVDWVASQESFILKNIYFSEYLLVAAYSGLLFLLFFIYQQRKKWLFMFLGSILLLQGIYIWEHWQLNSENQFYVFHRYKKSVLASKEGNRLSVFSDSTVTNNQLQRLINPICTEKAIQQTSFNSIKNLYSLHGQNLLVIDSLGVFPQAKHKIDYVLLRHSPKINLKRMIDKIQPKMIIADGSNYFSYTKRWEKTCKNRKLLFYNTNKKGALQIDY